MKEDDGDMELPEKYHLFGITELGNEEEVVDLPEFYKKSPILCDTVLFLRSDIAILESPDNNELEELEQDGYQQRDMELMQYWEEVKEDDELEANPAKFEFVE